MNELEVATKRTRTPKLTVEKLVNAVPKYGSITTRQLAIKVNCGRVLTAAVIKQAVEDGKIEMFITENLLQNFRRGKND
jgi:hypothetical protein